MQILHRRLRFILCCHAIVLQNAGREPNGLNLKLYICVYNFIYLYMQLDCYQLRSPFQISRVQGVGTKVQQLKNPRWFCGGPYTSCCSIVYYVLQQSITISLYQYTQCILCGIKDPQLIYYLVSTLKTGLKHLSKSFLPSFFKFIFIAFLKL